MRSSQATDSGKYVNGVYTSKNGNTANGGLNCPKGTRLYDTSMKDAIFYMPEDRGPNEDFVMLTQDVAPGVLPYYAISNYGRILNVKSGQILKPNYRPNGYEYECLSAEDCKYGQKKYTTHILVMRTFKPKDNMENLQVDHINGNKTENYVDKIMPDGTIQSNLRWTTPQENEQYRSDLINCNVKLNKEKADEIRALHDEGYSYKQIRELKGYDYVSPSTIQNVCRNIAFKDPNYTPKTYEDMFKNNPMHLHMISDSDAAMIRKIHNECGFNGKQIRDKFFPDFSESTICDIIAGRTHN